MIEFFLFTLLLLILSPLLGRYMAFVFEDAPRNRLPLLGSIETLLYRLAQIDPQKEMTWKEYLKALLFFNFFGWIILILLQLFQQYLPLNPQNLQGVEPLLAINTATSFVTNTNWQAYGGEITLSYFTQMVGLAVQNFLSAATGNAALLALIRGLSRRSTTFIGNFYSDLTRSVVYLLLPLSFLLAPLLISQGVIQNFKPYINNIPMGPVASQVAIKQLGTNGGGFFNANSAHPFENPTPFSNFLENLAILLIPAATPHMYGYLTNSRKQGWILFLAMFILFNLGLGVALLSEHTLNPVLNEYPVLEGKETRFGSNNSILWTLSTTATANGSINSMISSLSPLSGGVALFNLMVGEVIFGGVGVGFCSILMFVLLTVFLAGLMVGRTPEFFGKKIEKKEMQWVMVAILAPAALILFGSSLASFLPIALKSVSHKGPHGLSEILYTFSSTSANNGSSFAGLDANTPFYNSLLAAIMLLGRVAILIPSLAVANLLAQKNTTQASAGTFATDTPLFLILLISVIFIIGALTFFPALSLGPIVEQLLMLKGESF